MNIPNWIKSNLIPLLMMLVGFILIAIWVIWISHIENNPRYANWDNIHEHLSNLDAEDPNEISDPNLIWMMRSKEYNSATKDGKFNMRRSWAIDYIDRDIGRFARISIFWGLIIIPIIILLSKQCS